MIPINAVISVNWTAVTVVQVGGSTVTGAYLVFLVKRWRISGISENMKGDGKIE